MTYLQIGHGVLGDSPSACSEDIEGKKTCNETARAPALVERQLQRALDVDAPEWRGLRRRPCGPGLVIGGTAFFFIFSEHADGDRRGPVSF